MMEMAELGSTGMIADTSESSLGASTVSMTTNASPSKSTLGTSTVSMTTNASPSKSTLGASTVSMTTNASPSKSSSIDVCFGIKFVV
jgi:hypothetical protein